MEKLGWKIIAIIFIILFAIIIGIFIWSYNYTSNETERTNICYYEFCKDYPQANYADNLCTCYDYDLLNNLQAVDYKYYT